MDSKLISKAKAWGRKRGISLSRVIEAFFEHLTGLEQGEDLSPWVKNLTIRNSPFRKLTDALSGLGNGNIDEARVLFDTNVLLDDRERQMFRREPLWH